MNYHTFDKKIINIIIFTVSISAFIPLIGIFTGLSAASISTVALLKVPHKSRELLEVKHHFETFYIQAEIKRLQKQKIFHLLMIIISLFGILGQIGIIAIINNSG